MVRRVRRLVWVLGMLALGGCAEHHAQRERGGGGAFFDRVEVIAAPAESRCARFKKGGSAGRACAEAEALGLKYVHQLSAGEPVCMEGGFGDVPGQLCHARGLVADVAPGRLLMDVREAQPGSKWFGQESRQLWFEEGALVDLFLAERGF